MKKALLIFLAFIAIAVGGLYLFGSSLLAWYVSPDHAFGEQPLPLAPDYAEQANWAAWPGTDSAANLVPEGVASVPENARKADVFFVHPTTYYDKETWIAALDNPQTNAVTDIMGMAEQASAFNGCCNIYAPRYRQTALGAYAATDKNVLRAALNESYQDVKRAFEHYLSIADPSRPLVLASHSQGTAHLQRLLVDVVQSNPALRQRLVAAYIIGNRIPETLFTQGIITLPICESDTDTGCVISWDSFEDGANTSLFPPTAGHWTGDDYELLEPLNTICVNPITWQRDDVRSAKADHLGAMLPHLSGLSDADKAQTLVQAGIDIPALLTQEVTAQCDTGQNINGLHVSKDRDDRLKSGNWINTGTLHPFDIRMFWGNIRQNAMDRVEAHLQRLHDQAP